MNYSQGTIVHHVSASCGDGSKVWASDHAKVADPLGLVGHYNALIDVSALLKVLLGSTRLCS